jgi:hypothetical protein
MRWFVLTCGLLLMAAPVFAATQNAVVYGTVYDAAGNPMAGVSVTLENPALGFTRGTTTGSDGSYNFAEVPPAEGYRLTAAQGAKKLDIRAGITVNVGDERVILPPLKEQAAATTVVEKTTEGQAVRNETSSTTISGVITGDQLRSLPLYNRNFLALGLLTPNTHDVEGGSELAGASFSVGGNRPNQNNFLLDGADNVASSSNQAVPFQVNDSVQEFRLISSTASAEYGRNAGGTVNVVTRRGGNGFHGSVFGYFGSDRLNANNPLSVYSGSTFDQAAAYAGSTSTTGFAGFSPLRYNDYVATAEALGFCTNSLSAFTGVAGSATCFSGGTGGTGENTRFDPAAVLAANNRFKPSFDSKQFGVNAGGPLVKDKVFWFLSYEGTRINNPNPIFERVPTTFDKTDDPYGLNGTTVNGFAPGILALDYDLGACTSVNAACGSTRGILSLFPNSNVVGVPGVLEFYQGEAPNYTNVHNGLARVDIVKSASDSFTLRYVAQGLNQLHDDTLPEQANYPGNGAFRGALNQSFNATWSHSFSSTLINEARFGFQRFHVNEAAQDASFDATTLGNPGPNIYGTASNYPNRALATILLNGMDAQYSGAVRGTDGAYCSWFEFFAVGPCQAPTLDYLFPFARLGAPLNAPSEQQDDTWTVADSVSWTRGKHSIKFGAEFRNLNNRTFNGAWQRGFVYSSDIGEFTSDSGLSCNQQCPSPGVHQSFQWPTFDFAQGQTAPYNIRLQSYAASGFVQDTWRIHPRVTVNLGLRYDFFSVPKEANNQLWNFDPVANGLVQEGRTSVQDPYGFFCGGAIVYESVPFNQQTSFVPSGLWDCRGVGSDSIGKSNHRNFSPRLGVAWDLFGSGRTVLRVGYGLFYDQLPLNYYARLMYNRPTGIANGNSNATYGIVTDFSLSNYCSAVAPDTCGSGHSFLNPATAALFRPNEEAAMPFGVSAIDAGRADTSRVHQFNATVQQQLGGHTALEVGYVGSLGRRIPVVNNSNFANEWVGLALLVDNFSTTPIFTTANLGSSDYHSLMARARVADWHGLRFNATYTWSKATDNVASSRPPLLPVTGPNMMLGYQLTGTRNFTPFCIYVNAFCAIAPLTFPNINFAPSAVTTTGAGAVYTTPYTLPQDPFNYLIDDHGRSDFDSNHRLVLDYTWEIPGPKSSALKSNWAVSGIFVARSGQPFTIFSGPILGEITQRATATGTVSVSSDPNGAIDPTNLLPALATCPAAVFPSTQFQPVTGTACTGNTARNAFTGPNYVSMDLAVQKGFRLFGEGRMLTLRAEFYNLFNRENFYNPISTLSTDGTNLNPDFGKIKSAHDPRQIQFGVRYSW